MTETAEWFESGGNRLFGILHRPEDSQGTVLLLHGFGGNHTGDHYSFVTLARALCDRGYTVFRFDYAGSGDSEGDFAEQRLSTCIRDVKNAVAHLASEGVDTDSVGMVGHSMGGSVALEAATDIDADVLVAWSTIAAYEDNLSEKYLELIKKQDDVAFYGFRFPTEKLLELLEYGLEARAAELNIPTLFVHGEADNSVHHTHSERLYEHATEPKDLLLLENSDHIFTNPDEREELIHRTVEWFEEYL